MRRNLPKFATPLGVCSILLALGWFALVEFLPVSVSRAADPAVSGGQTATEEHPIEPALRIAQASLKELEKIKDYTATITKRERVGSTLKEYEYLSAKVRHEPFSVYLLFQGPDNVKGREVIYAPAANDGNLLAHEVGLLRNVVGTLSLKPNGLLAMQGQRYPISDIGIRNLVTKLIERAEKEKLPGASCEVKFYKNGKIDGRSVTCIEVLHPTRRPEHDFYRARVFVDNELKIPIRYEAHDFPAKAGDEPQLLEEYTYTNLKLNTGLTDADFDKTNAAYNFP